MKRIQLDVVVGGFVLCSLALLMWGTMQIGVLPGGFAPEGRLVFARFANVAGLDAETDLLMAGVPVGKVAKIELAGHEARVTLRIEDPALRIPVDSVLAIRSRGLLGERVLEILPGTSQQMLVAGGSFTRTRVAADIDLLIDRATEVARDLGEVAATFRNVLGGPEGEETLQEMLTNLRAVSADLRRIVGNNEEDIERMVRNLAAFSTDLAQLTEQNRDGLEELLQGLQIASRKMSSVLDSFARISARMEDGQGTLGKLLTDDALYEELNGTIGEARSTLVEVRRAAEELQEQIPVSILTSLFGSLF